jgi:hypothetical protein
MPYTRLSWSFSCLPVEGRAGGGAGGDSHNNNTQTSATRDTARTLPVSGRAARDLELLDALGRRHVLRAHAHHHTDHKRTSPRTRTRITHRASTEIDQRTASDCTHVNGHTKQCTHRYAVVVSSGLIFSEISCCLYLLSLNKSNASVRSQPRSPTFNSARARTPTHLLS